MRDKWHPESSKKKAVWKVLTFFIQIPWLTPANPIIYLIPKRYQNENEAKIGDKKVKIAERIKDPKMTYRPPNHSDMIPPNNEVVK